MKISLSLADAIITQESNYDQWAIRYEPNYNYTQVSGFFANVNRTSVVTEMQLQKFSYGLFQLMGGTLRSLNYNGPLMQLCADTDLNMQYGLMFINQLMKTYRFTDDIIAAYNAGSVKKNKIGDYVNQLYVDSVKKIMAMNAL